MLPQTDLEKYNDVFQAFQNGFISLQEWQDYCQAKLEEVLTQNIDVLKRLKDR